MKDEFKKCLKNKKIIKFAKAKEKINIEIKAAKEDFKDAKSFLKDKNFKYATIAGYYSLFHSDTRGVYLYHTRCVKLIGRRKNDD